MRTRDDASPIPAECAEWFEQFEVLEELREGLALRQVARVLKLYATALSGRDVAVRGIDEMDSVDRFGPDQLAIELGHRDRLNLLHAQQRHHARARADGRHRH